MSVSNEIVTTLNGALSKHGFRKRSSVLVRPLTDGNTGFLGLSPRILQDGTVAVFVVAGVRHSAIYERGVALGAYPASKTNPTLSVPLEYLDPARKAGEYQFDPSRTGDAKEIARLTGDVIRLVLPFYERLDSAERALEAIGQGTFETLHNVQAFVPIAMLQSGDPAGAVQSAKKLLASMDQSRGAGKQYKIFVDKIVKATRH